MNNDWKNDEQQQRVGKRLAEEFSIGEFSRNVLHRSAERNEKYDEIRMKYGRFPSFIQLFSYNFLLPSKVCQKEVILPSNIVV